MSVSLAALLQPATRDQVRSTWVTGLEALGIPASRWRKGGTASSMLTIIAQTYSDFSVTMVSALSAQFLDYATGTWLIILAKQVYNVDAIVATFASGQLTLVNAGGGVFPFVARAATFQDSSTKQTYTNVAPFTLNPGQTLTIDIEATTAGTVGNAIPGAIDALVTTMLEVTCSNALSVVGTDAESDPDLRQRCRDKLASLSVRGPRNAYAWAARTATRGGAPVNVNRVAISTSSSKGKVVVTIASPSGAADPLDIAAVADFIEANVRPEGVTVVVNSVTTAMYTASITVWCRAAPGLAEPDILAAIEDALLAYIEAYPIGGLAKPPSTQGYLWASGVEGVIKSAHPSIFAVDGVTVDLALAIGQVAVDGVSDANISVRLVTS